MVERIQKEEEGQQRIIIVGVNWLGDALFMSPAIRAIRKAHPHAHVACLVPPRCRELLKGNPHLNAILCFDERGADRGLAGFSRLVRTLRAGRFDAAYLFHRSFTRTIAAALAGIPQRIGYSTWKRAWLLTKAVPMPPKDTLHKIQYFLNLLERYGIPSDGTHYDLSIPDADRLYAQGLLRAAGCDSTHLKVAIHAGANWHLKRWPAKLFARLGDLLSERHQARILFIGSADDRPLAEGIVRRMTQPASILCGQTTLTQLAALMKEVDWVVSNDSGPLHIAAAVRARVIGLFGPTRPELTAPPAAENVKILFGSIGCPVPCYRQWCPINLCMRQITPENVAGLIGKN